MARRNRAPVSDGRIGALVHHARVSLFQTKPGDVDCVGHRYCHPS